MADRARALRAVAERAERCRDCDLWSQATQTVFGRGPVDARLMLVGEQPGDQEDRAGEPFVGPAGRLLRDAVEEAGLSYESLYVTNAVKHFKWKPRGKRRIHQTPNRTEVVACHHWFDDEFELVGPGALVVLGATAGKSIFGPAFRIGAAQGQVLEHRGTPTVATPHPSAILRNEDGPERRAAFAGLVSDLARAADLTNVTAS